MTKAQQQEYKIELSKSLLQFMKVIDPSACKVDFAQIHKDMESVLMDLDVIQLCMVAPRGHGKSTISCVAIALWHVFLEDTYRTIHGLPRRIDPSTGKPEHSYVLIQSKTQKDAKERLDSIKHILNNSPNFRALFGDWSKSTCPTWNMDAIELKNGTMIAVYGTGQNLHGRNHLNVRPTLLIVDDPENLENTKTPESKESNMRALIGSAIPGLYPTYGRAIVIGTPITPDCMVINLHHTWGTKMDHKEYKSKWFMHDAEEQMNWTSIGQNEVQFTRNKGDKVIQNQYGYWIERKKVFWEAWLPKRGLLLKKEEIRENPGVPLGEYYRQYECKIIGDEERVFLQEYFDRTWDGHPVWDSSGRSFLEIHRLGSQEFAKPIYKHVIITGGYDAAYTVNNHSSYSTAAAIATDVDDNRYELPGLKTKVLFGQLVKIYLEFQKRYKLKRALGEANGPQAASFEQLQSAGLRIWKDANVYEKKIERISTLHQPISSGQYYFQEDTPFREEANTFPRGKIDYMDSFEKADRIRRRGTRAEYRPFNNNPDKPRRLEDMLRNYVSSMSA